MSSPTARARAASDLARRRLVSTGDVYNIFPNLSAVRPSFIDAPLDEDLIGELPISEVFSRIRWAGAMDMEVIDRAIVSSTVGIMAPITDMILEALRMAPSVLGMVLKRIEQVAGAEYELSPAEDTGEDAKAKEVCNLTRRWLLKAEGFDQLLVDTMWSFVHGRAASQTNWTRVVGDEVKWAIRDWTWIHPGRLSFGPQRELRVVERFRQTGLYYAVGPALDELPTKFVTQVRRDHGDYGEREGIGVVILFWLFMSRFTWRQRMELIELFAKGWRILEAEGGIDSLVGPTALAEGRLAADALGTETTTASFSPGVKFKVEWPHPETGLLHSQTPEEIKAELAQLILGQPKTTTGDSYGKGAQNMKEEQNTFERADARKTAAVIEKRLILPFVGLNVGANALHLAPRFKIRVDPEDQIANQTRLNSAIQVGVPVALSQYRREVGIKEIRQVDGKAEPYLVLEPLDSSGKRARIIDPEGSEPEIPQMEPPPPPVLPGAPGAKPGPGGKPSPGAGGGGSREGGAKPKAKPPAADDEEDEGRKLRAEQPSGAADESDNVDRLAARGLARGAKLSGAWADRIVASVEGLTDPVKMHRAITNAAASLDEDELAASLDHHMVRGCMMGCFEAAADADDQAEEDEGGDEVLAELDTDEPILLFGAMKVGPNGGVVDFITHPFREAIAWFLSKKVVKRATFDRLRGEAKKKAFSIAGQAKASMVKLAHEELGNAIAEGRRMTDCRGELAKRFESNGWTPLNPSHAELVYRNAVMGSYSAGRYAQMTQPAVLAARPYWLVTGVDDSRTRPAHKRQHGKVFRGDDPSFKRLPWGHNCRCRNVSLSPKDLARRGLTVSPGAMLSDVPDEGWDEG